MQEQIQNEENAASHVSAGSESDGFENLEPISAAQIAESNKKFFLTDFREVETRYGTKIVSTITFEGRPRTLWLTPTMGEHAKKAGQLKIGANLGVEKRTSKNGEREYFLLV